MAFLVQQLYLRYTDGAGQGRTAVILRDPLPLHKGKGAWPLFSAGVEFLPKLCDLGHSGISIYHFAFDRALHDSLVRHFKEHFSFWARHTQSPSSTVVAGGTPTPLLQWVLGTGCACHDTHNAFKWGMHQQFQNLELLKELYIAIESIRNSYGLLVRYMPKWLLQKLKFVECSDHASGLGPLWTALGVDSATVGTMLDLGHCVRKG